MDRILTNLPFFAFQAPVYFSYAFSSKIAISSKTAQVAHWKNLGVLRNDSLAPHSRSNQQNEPIKSLNFLHFEESPIFNSFCKQFLYTKSW